VYEDYTYLVCLALCTFDIGTLVQCSSNTDYVI